MGNEENAAEIFQEAMTKLFSSLNYIDASKGIKNYAYQIAKNTAIDRAKKKDALNFKQNLFSKDTEEEISVEDLTFHEETPEIQAIKNAKRELIDFCFNSLKEGQRLIASMRIFGELSYEDISLQVNLSVQAVKSNLHRARQNLMKCISKEEK